MEENARTQQATGDYKVKEVTQLEQVTELKDGDVMVLVRQMEDGSQEVKAAPARLATGIGYDNSGSNLEAATMQDAIDELANGVVYLTEDEYEALVAADEVKDNVQYNILEE